MKGQGWCSKNSPNSWDGFLPGPRVLWGTSRGVRKVRIVPPASPNSGNCSPTPVYPDTTWAELASSFLARQGAWDQMPPSLLQSKGYFLGNSSLKDMCTWKKGKENSHNFQSCVLAIHSQCQGFIINVCIWIGSPQPGWRQITWPSPHALAEITTVTSASSLQAPPKAQTNLGSFSFFFHW